MDVDRTWPTIAYISSTPFSFPVPRSIKCFTPEPKIPHSSLTMPFFALAISADLDGLTNFRPRAGCDDADYRYYFKVKCGNCGDVSPKEMYVTLSETVPAPNTKTATVHLSMKCKGCLRTGTITMVPGYGSPLTLEKSQAKKSTNVMVFEFRGFEPIEFSFRDGWIAESTSGTPYEIDPTEGEFAEYDEKSELPVGLSELKAEFVEVKKIDRNGKTYYA